MRPTLFGLFPDAAELVGQRLDGAKDGMEKGPLSLKQLRHEQPQRFRKEKQNAEVDGDLEDSDTCHFKTSLGAAAPPSNTPGETAR